ncbi:MAG: glutamate-5-semialdehyde dehydrogenase [SAR86 cluster bacterium]|nr:glutamate-5-semialdehyde dehydrogenase [SAR86 cluster bacterium]
MGDSKDINRYMNFLGAKAKEAASVLSQTTTVKKNKALLACADAISEQKDEIIKANRKDLMNAQKKGIADTLIDRLELTLDRVDSMISGIHHISSLEDPVGELIDMGPTPSGIEVSRMRVPLGVVGIIYESRPNVTADAAALALKSGNAVILRGGSEAILTNRIISKCLIEGLKQSGLPLSTIQLVDTVDREAVKVLLGMDKFLDVIIPRGGKGLVKLISDEAKVPVIKHLEGICHVYIDAEADLKKAVDVSVNAKTYRFGICGAMETLLISKSIAKQILPLIHKHFTEMNVELRGCQQTKRFISVKDAEEEDWGTEYLSPILSIKLVMDVKEAIDHINKFGSGHTDSIVTENNDNVQKFLNEVDSSSVMHNLPTCWADGFEYGLGAEVGISTDKIHARGPVGLEGLTSQKFIVKGDANLR